jgi:hypothetical protein
VKKLVESVEFVAEGHHSTHALENVTLDREVTRLRDKAKVIALRLERLEGDEANAAAEEERLRRQNAELSELGRRPQVNICNKRVDG